MKVILMVLNNFVNDSRVLKEAITLKKNGYDVRVVALHEEGLKEFESQSGISVHRIKLRTRKLPTNLFFQLFKYGELAFKTIKKYKKVDYFHSNDLSPLPIAVTIKKLFNNNIKIIYDAHEYETEKSGLNGVRKKLTKITEKCLIRYTDSMITVSESIAKEYSKLYNIKKPYVVLNCPNHQKVTRNDLFRKKFNISRESIIFLYQGALTKGRQIELLLTTFSKLKNSKAVLVVMGFGQLKELVQKYDREYENIFYHKAVSYDVLLNYTSSADIGFSFLEDTCLNHSYALPNKFFEYVMAGLAVVSNDLPELKMKIKNNNIGYITKELEVDALARTIKSIIRDDKIKTFKDNSLMVSNMYNWEEQEKVLLDAYKNA